MALTLSVTLFGQNIEKLLMQNNEQSSLDKRIKFNDPFPENI